MIKISVIISVYNKEKYISRCLDSVLSQTIDMDDIEIICIDDKSTDNSLDILNDYSKKNKNIHIIESKFNSGGPGEPRNKGLDLANGEYIYFVDADDFLGKETLERVYKCAKLNNSDIVIGKIVGFGGRGTAKSMFKKSVNKVDLANSMIIYTLNPLKLFKTSFLRSKKIRFPPNIITGEDQLFTMKAYLCSNVISILSDYDYYYLAKTDGYHAAGAYIHPKDFYWVMGRIFDYIKKSNLNDIDKENVMRIFLERHFSFSRTKNFTIKIKDNEERNEWMHYLHGFIVNYVPKNIDEKLKLQIRIKLFLIRKNDLKTLRDFELENKSKKHDFEIVNNRVLAVYSSLKKYDVLMKHLDITEDIQLYNFLENFIFEGNKFEVSGRIKYSAIYKSPSISCVLKHRISGSEKYFKVDVANNRFNFCIDLNELGKNNSDFGIWDVFFKIQDFESKLWRIGNKKDQYNYPNGSSYFKYDFELVQIEPYFTKNFDNLSFNVRKTVNNFNFVLNCNNNKIILNSLSNIFFSNNLNIFYLKNETFLKNSFVENNESGSFFYFDKKFKSIPILNRKIFFISSKVISNNEKFDLLVKPNLSFTSLFKTKLNHLFSILYHFLKLLSNKIKK